MAMQIKLFAVVVVFYIILFFGEGEGGGGSQWGGILSATVDGEQIQTFDV